MSNQQYTPTTRGVRSAYLRVLNGQIQGANAVSVAAEFDRWLAERDAQKWQEGYDAAYGMAKGHGHADHIEQDQT